MNVMGAEAFDAELGADVVVMPEFINIKAGNKGAPSRDLIPETTVASQAQLVAGDWVYFMNYPEYEEINDILEDNEKERGPFEGENAVYLGNDLYKGFGVDAISFDGMVQMLIKQYNDLVKRYDEEVTDKYKKKFTKKTARAGSAETLDRLVPGIESTTVRRVMANDDLKTQVADAMVGARAAELLVKLNSAAPAEKHKIWKSLDDDLRDKIKEKVMANKHANQSTFKHIFPRQYHQYHAPRYSPVGPVGLSR
jgi:Protein-glutamine gamma-glutamyltransferase